MREGLRQQAVPIAFPDTEHEMRLRVRPDTADPVRTEGEDPMKIDLGHPPTGPPIFQPEAEKEPSDETLTH